MEMLRTKINGLENMGYAEFQAELQKGGRLVVYQYVISLLVITFRRESKIYLIKSGESAIIAGLPYTLLSAVVGWWGIPWGIIYTFQVIFANLGGGKDITPQFLAALKNQQSASS